MYRKSIYIIILILCLPLITNAEGTYFSVKINPNIQQARIGMNMGNIHPFVGLDYLSVGAKVNIETTIEYGYYPYYTVDIEAEVEAKASLIMPTIGLKYYLSQATVKPYLVGSYIKSFPSIDLDATLDGDTESLIGDDEKDFIKELMSFWGFNIGFGTEWAINEHFSLGGEYGIRFIFISGEYEGEGMGLLGSLGGLLGGGMIDLGDELKTEVTGNLRSSHAAVVLNFYF
ncbi:outer membrane beta-barrel protein [candidate division KSB1 bacterium]|nr:outer membrane beta-barrel protein [candidate division KSB1 bacterium]